MPGASNNSYGDVSIAKDKDFRAYDKLPAELRRALWNTLFDCSAWHLLNDTRKASDPQRLAAALNEAEAYMRPVHAYAVYGPDHPAVTRNVFAAELKKAGLMRAPNRVAR